MTEPDWLAATDPQPMLEFVSGKVSDRKLRLFAVACCRRAMRRVAVHARAEHAVDLAEGFADGEVTADEMRQWYFYANVPAEHACRNATETEDVAVAADCAALNAAWGTTARDGRSWVDRDADPTFDSRLAVEQGIQCGLLRDIISNPFRPTPFDPAWRTSTAVALAEAVYAARAFQNLPILADALEEAGCDAADILAHCRGEGPHVRGCWVVDAVLGKA